MLNYISADSPDDYKKKQEAIQKAIKQAAKKEPTEILKAQSNQLNAEGDLEKQKLCEMSRILFNEGLEQFKKNELKFEEFADDLHRSMLAIKKAI